MSGPMYWCDRCPATATPVAAADIRHTVIWERDALMPEKQFDLCLPCWNELVDFTQTRVGSEPQTKYDREPLSVHTALCSCTIIGTSDPHRKNCEGCTCG